MPFEDAVGAPLQDGRETMMRSGLSSRDEAAGGIPGKACAVPEQSWLVPIGAGDGCGHVSRIADATEFRTAGLGAPVRPRISHGNPGWTVAPSVIRYCGRWMRRGFANPESAAPDTAGRLRSPLLRGFTRSAAAFALVIDAEWRKRACGRGSGAAESAARRATPISLSLSLQNVPQARKLSIVKGGKKCRRTI
jgi:hypothetical protein